MAKKNKIILFCEGISDLAIISLLLEQWYGYKYIQNPIEEKCFEISGRKEKLAWYIHEDMILGICAVGGCDRFSLVYNTTFKAHVENDLDIKKVLFVVDADSDSEIEIINKIKIDELHLEDGKWMSSIVINRFNMQKEIETFLKIIPNEKSGAIENVFITSLSITEEHITKESLEFVNSLSTEASKYIRKNRVKLKAKLGTIMNLIDPEHTFKAFKERFEYIDLQSPIIHANFDFLDFLK